MYANFSKGEEEEAMGDFAFATSQNWSSESTAWYFDLSASHHYLFHREWYVNFIEDKGSIEYDSLGDEWSQYVRGCGDA